MGAKRTENLVRRIMHFDQRTGFDHAGFNDGHIINPYNIPLLK